MRTNSIRRNRQGIVGAAACPDALEFYTQNPAKRKPSPGGCAPRSESKIYMTAGGSHTSTTVVRLKPDRMRSKVTASYQPMVMIGGFDLISRN